MKILIVGLGSIGQRHVRNLRMLLGQSVELLAYRTRGLTHVLNDSQQITAQFGLHEQYGLKVCPDLDSALSEQPDAAFVCNPNSLHLRTALAAAQAGCHLFIEKPLSHSLEGVADLMAVVERKRLAALVAYQLRFHPCLLTARRILQDSAIGRVLAVRAQNGEYMPGWHPYEDYRQTYAAKLGGGGGVVLAQSHEIDYLCWLFGAPRRVFAIGGHLSELEIEVEDVASALMECMEAGVAVPVHLQLDYLQRPAQRTCEIIGERGRIWIDLIALTVHSYSRGAVTAQVHDFSGFQRNQLFLDEVKHFLACMRGEAEPAVNLQAGARSLEVALAIKYSLTSHRMVELN